MASFRYTVDTQPMAEEMRGVARHVDVTTTAVVAMQKAVIEAEGKAADHVCNNVNRGFHVLIRSQISQKIAKLQSEVDSHVMQLLQQKTALLGIKKRMERDYNMIGKRYKKLFNGLNANLKNRIYELDKPTLNFALKEVEKVSNRRKQLAATMPITQLESLSSSQRIIASNIKEKGHRVISSMKAFIFEMNEQKKLTDQILINSNYSAEVGINYIPILVLESNRDKSNQLNVEVHIPQYDFGSAVVSSIKNEVYAQFSNFKWQGNGKSYDEVSGTFSKRLSEMNTSARVKEMAMKLFQAGEMKMNK